VAGLIEDHLQNRSASFPMHREISGGPLNLSDLCLMSFQILQWKCIVVSYWLTEGGH